MSRGFGKLSKIGPNLFILDKLNDGKSKKNEIKNFIYWLIPRKFIYLSILGIGLFLEKVALKNNLIKTAKANLNQFQKYK